MPLDNTDIDPKVIEEITREVKSLGENYKAVSDSMNRDLAAVRKIAEEAKGAAAAPEFKSQVDALTASITEKNTVLEKAMAARMSAIEAKQNRSGFGGSGGNSEQEAKARGQAILFNRTVLAGRGQLKVGNPVVDDEIDFKGIEAYDRTYPMYLRRDERGLDSMEGKGFEAKALQIGSDPDGGYWVPRQMSARIITQVFESSPIRQIATVETISTDALEIPNDYGEVGAGWVGEQEARPETSTPPVGVMRIGVNEMYAMPKATQKLLEDATIDVEAWLADKIAQKFARLEATAFVLGSGVKQPRGLLSYPGGTTNPGTVEQIHGGDANLITADGLIKLTYSIKEPYMANARFLMQRASVALVMLLKDSQGRYLWQPALALGAPSSLLSYPITWAADMPAVAAGALPVAFGDFRQAYTVVDRLGISTLRDPFTAKPFVLFYTRRRVGGDVANFEAYKLLLIST